MDIGGYQAVGQFLDKYMTYSMSRAMQQDMNEYNDPKNQIARMRAAGLSPWSYSGEGNTAAQPVMSESKLGESLGAIADRKLAQRQLDIQESLSSAQAARERSQTEVNNTLAETQRVLLRYLPESEVQRIRNMSSNSDYTERQAARYDEAIDQQLAVQKSQEALNYANSDRARVDMNRIKRLLPYEESKLIAETQELRANVGVLKTQAKLNNAQISNVTSMFIKNMEEVDRIGLENWMLKYQKSIIEKTGIKPGTPPWTALTDMFARIRHDLGNKTLNRGSW